MNETNTLCKGLTVMIEFNGEFKSRVYLVYQTLFRQSQIIKKYWTQVFSNI